MILTVFAGLLLFQSMEDFKTKGILSSLYFPFIWFFLIYSWFKAHIKVYRVEFDDEYLYIIRRKGDVLIPLENVKDIEMRTLGGMWRVDLYYADIVGDHFYFKPSLLYPFNYKSKDHLVNLLWKKIEMAKSKKQQISPNALHS